MSFVACFYLLLDLTTVSFPLLEFFCFLLSSLSLMISFEDDESIDNRPLKHKFLSYLIFFEVSMVLQAFHTFPPGLDFFCAYDVFFQLWFFFTSAFPPSSSPHLSTSPPLPPSPSLLLLPLLLFLHLLLLLLLIQQAGFLVSLLGVFISNFLGVCQFLFVKW